ncbi:hypothetical protein BH10BAC2_BH10BAC2_32700 [soil metagenome]
MSEDLRYYFFDHEAEEHPSIPADVGWKQMQQLLDKELPNSSKRIAGSYLFFIAAVLFGVVFMVTALPLQTYFKQKEFATSIKKEGDKKEQDDNLIPADKTYELSTLQKTTAIPNKQNISGNSSIKEEHLLPIFNEHNSIASPLKQAIQNEQTVIENNRKENSLQEVTSVIVPENTTTKAGDTSVEINVGQKKKRTTVYRKSWQFNAGAAANISLSNTFQSLRPYPFAEIKYQFTPKFFAGVSVASFSHVGSRASGIKKTVYINDTAYNVSNYNETLNYTRLTYADIALTGGIKITKQIYIQSGFQISRLLSFKTNTTLEPYDFNMNRLTVTGQDVSTLPPTPSAAPVYNNRIDVKKIDIRYVGGINYNLKKLSLSLQYQGGINPVLQGDAVTADKNKIITLKAAFRFK